MSYAKRAVFGSGWAIAALILSNALAYLFRMYLTRSLSVEDYGLFYAVFNFIILFLFFRDMGLNVALTKFIPEYRLKGRFGEMKAMMASVLIIQLAASLILCLILFISRKSLAIHYFRDAAARQLILIFIIYILLSVFIRFFRCVFIGYKSFFFGSFLEPFNNLAVLAFSAGFLALGSGVAAPALAYLSSLLLSIIISVPVFLSLFNPFKEKITGLISTMKEISLFGLPMMIASLGGQIIGYMDTIMLTFFTDMRTVGIYNVILPSALIFLIFGRGITTVMLPLISELRTKGDEKKIAEGVAVLYKYSLVLAIPLISVVMAFPDFFLLLFFGKGYVEGALAFQVLLLGVLFYLISQINESVLIGIGKPGMVTKITLIAAGLNIILNLLLIPRLGILGAAIATAASYMTMLVLTTRSIRGELHLRSPIRQWTLTLLSGVGYVMIILGVSRAIELSPWLEILVSVAIGGIAYLVLVFWMKIIDKEEIRRYMDIIFRKA